MNGVEVGDTGRRDIASALLPGWVTESTSAIISRNGNIVTLEVRVEYAAEEPSAVSSHILTVPAGFRPDSNTRSLLSSLGGNPGTCYPTLYNSSGTVFRAFTGVSDNQELVGTVSWIATDAWPATLPGTAA